MLQPVAWFEKSCLLCDLGVLAVKKSAPSSANDFHPLMARNTLMPNFAVKVLRD
jgi:hypothetical protein